MRNELAGSVRYRLLSLERNRRVGDSTFARRASTRASLWMARIRHPGAQSDAAPMLSGHVGPMSEYLTSLVARAQAPELSVGPRLSSIFEAPTGASGREVFGGENAEVA